MTYLSVTYVIERVRLWGLLDHYYYQASHIAHDLIQALLLSYVQLPFLVYSVLMLECVVQVYSCYLMSDSCHPICMLMI